MENKITLAGFGAGFLTAIIWLWAGFLKVTKYLWGAYFEKVRFPWVVVVLFLLTFSGFFVGRNYFPIQNPESCASIPQVMPPVMLPENRQPTRSNADMSEADKLAKAKAKAEEANRIAKAKAEAEEVDRLAKAEAKAKAEAEEVGRLAKAKAEVGIGLKREILTVKSRRAIIVYNKDPMHPLSLTRIKDGVNEPTVITCLPVKIQPMYFLDTSYVLRATMLESGVDVVETFVGDEGPWVWIYENGKMTVTKDLNILPVPVVYAKNVQP